MARPGMMLACALIGVSACTGSAGEIDTAPLPTAYAPPYVCDYVPKVAVERMTGITDPLVNGSLRLAREDSPANGGCSAYQRTGERGTVLRIMLDSGGSRGQVENQLRDGNSKQLPEIVPGGFGYYANYPNDEAHVGAMLVKGQARLSIELVKGVKGRDNAADVVALMKLIAPKLITAPSPSADQNG
ncbi:hypothetical protein ACFPZ3_60740 [Nonomuraea insulae]|uniref:DUF3558 domain-containing protein n=2 Tax=Nonomuraea insulae TaxID=1616787 RepID=A0ABW1DAU4_9ACTN